MLKISVGRDLYTVFSTQGRLNISGVFQCYTLEPPTKNDGSKPRAIDNGTYPITIRWSDHFQRHVPHVERVPHFVAIEQHVGNLPRNTESCTLVGQQRGPAADFIGMSLKAFTALMSVYMQNATLRNPDSPESEHIWDVGTITYYDARPQGDQP